MHSRIITTIWYKTDSYPDKLISMDNQIIKCKMLNKQHDVIWYYTQQVKTYAVMIENKYYHQNCSILPHINYHNHRTFSVFLCVNELLMKEWPVFSFTELGTSIYSNPMETYEYQQTSQQYPSALVSSSKTLRWRLSLRIPATCQRRLTCRRLENLGDVKNGWQEITSPMMQ